MIINEDVLALCNLLQGIYNEVIHMFLLIVMDYL